MNRLAAAAMIALLAISVCRAQDDNEDPFKSLAQQAHVDVDAVLKKVKLCEKQTQESVSPLFLLLDTDSVHPLLVIRQDQLDQPYLLTTTLAQGTGERGLLPAQDLGSFLFHFRIAGDRLQLVRSNTGFRAQAGTPEAKAVANGYPDSVVASVDFSSTTDKSNGEGTYILPADALFLQDLADIDDILDSAYPSGGGGPTLSVDDSRIESAKSFPANTEIGVSLLYNQSSASPSNVLPDSRKLTIRVHYSIDELPDHPDFQPRKADPRVGYFTTDYEDFTRPDLKNSESPDVHLINHWDLEKKDPALPVSEVKKPITYWLDSSIPEAYRPAVRQGILSWNAALEALGYKDAIVVKDVDKDMTAKERAAYDPSSASYNVVRWMMGDDDGFAEAPSRVNPLTGEIFNANIRIGDLMSRANQGDVEIANVSRSFTGRLSEGDYLAAAARQAAADQGLIQASQPLTSEQQKELVTQFLTEIAAHETGHTLGLRHNFKGSEMLPYSQLGKDGLVSSSLMDYLPMNIPSKGKPGPYYQTKPGTYDMWAIRYGYQPLSGDVRAQDAALKSIADQSATDSRLAYATDEDSNGSDPDVRTFDLGRGPIPFAQQHMELSRELWSKLAKESPDQIKSWADLRREFGYGVSEYNYAAEAVAALVGGVRSRRDAPSVDGKAGQPAFEPVSGAEQREALDFLSKNVFADKPLLVPPSLLRRLGTDRLNGEPTAPYPMDAVVGRLQGNVLDALYSPQTLTNLTQGELLADSPSQTLSAADEMAAVRKSIWGELDGDQVPTIPLYRRNLQDAHIQRLIATMNSSQVPGEARSLAQHELRTLASDIQRNLDRSSRHGLAGLFMGKKAAARRAGDETSRAHLESDLRNIQEALKGTDQ